MPNLPTWAAAYSSLPFLERGRTRDGVDCWGLVCMVSKEVFGVELPTYDGLYFSTAEKNEISRLFTEGLPSWESVEPRPGAVILFRIEGKPLHVGIIITGPNDEKFDPGYFLHSEQDVDSCFEQYGSIRWAKRIVGFFEYAPAKAPLVDVNINLHTDEEVHIKSEYKDILVTIGKHRHA